jgi:hypothetical protein
MAQHDYVIGNNPGAALRLDLNDVLESIVTNNSGPTEPTIKFPNMWWYDETASQLKQRNPGNTAWVIVASKTSTNWVPFRNGVALGDAAVRTVGTSGAAVPLLNGTLAWSGAQTWTFGGAELMSIGSNGLMGKGSVALVGTVMAYLGASTPLGWLRLDGGTLGSADSGAIYDSDDYEELFILIWGSITNAFAPVVGGRGASAQADWNANKRITLPDAAGRVLLGNGTGTGLSQKIHGTRGGSEDKTTSQGNQSVSRATGSESTQNSSHTHVVDVMQPWLAINYLVKF